MKIKKYFKLACIIGIFVIVVILILKAIFMADSVTYSGAVDHNVFEKCIHLVLAAFALGCNYGLINDLKDEF